MYQTSQRTTARYSEVEAAFRKLKIILDLEPHAARETGSQGIRIFSHPLPERLASRHPAAPIAVLLAIGMFSGLILAAEIGPTAPADILGFGLRVWRQHGMPKRIACDNGSSWFKADHREPRTELELPRG